MPLGDKVNCFLREPIHGARRQRCLGDPAHVVVAQGAELGEAGKVTPWPEPYSCCVIGRPNPGGDPRTCPTAVKNCSRRVGIARISSKSASVLIMAHRSL